MKSGCHALRLAAAGFEPVGWGQDFGIFRQHAGQAGENVGEVFLGVDAQAAAVFYDGVEDGAFLTGFFIAEEQPVFGSELGGADGVFHKVVANFNSPVAKIGFEVGPLVDGVADGFAKFGLGQDGTPEGEFVDGFLESTVNHAAFGGAHGLAQGGAGFGFAQAFFNVIKVGELTEDPGDESRRLLGSFKKFPPDMGVAAHEFDPGFVLSPGWIDDVAVALDDALVVSRDDAPEAVGPASGAPGEVTEVAHRVVKDPKVTGAADAFALRILILDGRLPAVCRKNGWLSPLRSGSSAWT